MLTLQSSLYALALAACILCGLIFRGAKDRPLVFLYAFLGLVSASFVFEWLMYHPSWPAKSLWLGLLMATSLLIAPACWLFAKEITADRRPSLRSLSPWHFVAVFAGIAFLFPLFHSVHLGPDFANPQFTPSASQRLFIHTTMLISGVIFLLQAPIYLTLCVRVLRQHSDQAKVLFSNIENKTFNTLRILSLVVGMHWAVSLLRILHCVFRAGTGFEIFYAFVQVTFTVWAVFAVVRQTVVFSVDDRELIHDIEVSEGLPSGAAQPHYAKSALDAPARQRVGRNLREALNGRQLYRNNELSLRELCNEIGENPHYVSQVISQDFNTRFYDLINSYRVDYAKEALLADPTRTVIDIALDAGFNSKSSFNSAFKRHTSTTPTQFRQQLAAVRQPKDLQLSTEDD